MIEAHGLTKNYGNLTAVRDVSFSVTSREVVGLLGPNGAGKSTLLRMIAGFLGPTSGRVLVGGFEVAREPKKARASLGYMPESTPLYPELRVREYLSFRAQLKGVARGQRKRAIADALERTQTSSVSEKLIAHLSRGYRQRVGLADAILANPPLLILDEPTAGLDPNQIREVRALIRRLGEQHAVLVSTHILHEVEAACDRAIVLHKGSIAAQGSVEELRAQASREQLELVVRGSAEALSKVLEALPADLQSLIERQELEARSHGELVAATFELRPGASAEALGERLVPPLVRADLGVVKVAQKKASLEEIFAQITAEPGLEAALTRTRSSSADGPEQVGSA